MPIEMTLAYILFVRKLTFLFCFDTDPSLKAIFYLLLPFLFIKKHTGRSIGILLRPCNQLLNFELDHCLHSFAQLLNGFLSILEHDLESFIVTYLSINFLDSFCIGIMHTIAILNMITIN